MSGEKKAEHYDIHGHQINIIKWHPVYQSILITLGESSQAGSMTHEGTATDADTETHLNEADHSSSLIPSYQTKMIILDWSQTATSSNDSILFSAHLTDPINGLDVSEDGCYVVTCGSQSLTYWNITMTVAEGKGIGGLVRNIGHTTMHYKNT